MLSPLPLTHLQHFAAPINPLHQASRDERIQLATWEDNQPFSILGELEILASTIQGYIGQLAIDPAELGGVHSLDFPDRISLDLQKRNPFTIPELATWYFSNSSTYPKLCRYLELLDYLRLSLLISLQQPQLQAA